VLTRTGLRLGGPTKRIRCVEAPPRRDAQHGVLDGLELERTTSQRSGFCGRLGDPRPPQTPVFPARPRLPSTSVRIFPRRTTAGTSHSFGLG